MTETSPLTFVDTTQTLGSVGPVVPNTLAKVKSIFDIVIVPAKTK